MSRWIDGGRSGGYLLRDRLGYRGQHVKKEVKEKGNEEGVQLQSSINAFARLVIAERSQTASSRSAFSCFDGLARTNIDRIAGLELEHFKTLPSFDLTSIADHRLKLTT